MTHHQVAVLTNRTQTQGKDGMATIKRIKATVITIGRKIPKDGTNLMEMVKKVTEETNLITIKTRMERKGRERSQVVEMEVIAALVTALMTAQAQMCQYVKNKKKNGPLTLVCGHWASLVVGNGCTWAPHCVLVAKALRGAIPEAATILEK